MADLIKLFDFKPGNDLKSEFKLAAFDKPVQKEKESQPKDSNSPFAKALETVSNAISNKENPKEMSESKQVQNAEKLDKAEKETKEILNSVSSYLKQLKENPAYKKTIEKFEKIVSRPVSLDELMKSLNQLVQLLMNVNQLNQKIGMTKPEQSAHEISLMKGLKNGLNQLKDLMKDDLINVKQILASMQNGNLSIASLESGSKEKRIFDIRIEKGVQKNSEKNKETGKKETISNEAALKTPGEALKAKEVKEKLESQPLQNEIKDKNTPKKESGEKLVKSKDQEMNLGKKESDFQNVMIQKIDAADKNFKVENSRNIDRAQRAEIGKQIIDQIGEKVTGIIGKNYSQITLQLKPEELGNVKIVLEMKNDTIKGRIIVDNNEVKDIVQENINQIKSILQDSGVKLGELEVSTNSQGQSFEQQNKEDQFQKMVMQNQKVFSFLSQFQTYERGFEESYPVLDDNRIFLKA